MVRQRKLETLAVVLIVLIGVLGLATIKLAAVYSIDLAGKAWSIEVGNIVVTGDIPQTAMDGINGLGEVESAKLVTSKVIVAQVNGTPVSVALIYNPSPNPPMGYEVNSTSGDILVYLTSENTLVIKPGDRVFVPGYGYLTVDGEADGVVRIIGSTDATLFVPLSVVEKVKGEEIDILAVVARGNVNLTALAGKIRGIIRSSGGTVDDVMIQTAEDNPAAKPMRSMANAIEVFVSTALLVAVFLVAGSEATLLERNIREIGVLKAVGLDAIRATFYYAGHNIVRGLAGIVAGLLLSVPLSEYLVSWGAQQAHGRSMEILLERYPYSPDIGTMLWVGGIAGIVIVVGSLLPPLIGYRVPTSKALRFTGLVGRARGRMLGGRVRIAYHIRRAASRPWMTIFLVLFIALAWGAASSIPMSVRGTDVIGAEIKSYGYDASLLVNTFNTSPSEVVNIAKSAMGVEDAEAWASMWRAAKLKGEDVMLESCVSGSWKLGPALAEGRWPGPGEAVITETLSKVYDIGVGDSIVLETDKGSISLEVVGVARTHSNNGRIVFLYKDDYSKIVNENFAFLHLRTPNNAEEVALHVKAMLLEKGIPATIGSTKEEMLRQHEESSSFLRIFLSIINASTLIGSFAGLTVLVLVDLAGRLRELGVLRAIGFTNLELAATVVGDVLLASIIAAPLAYIVGISLSSIMLRLMEDAMGFLEPVARVSDLLWSGWILIPSLLLAYLASLLYLRRQTTSSLLRVE